MTSSRANPSILRAFDQHPLLRAKRTIRARPPRRHGGFTLIELLVVIAIIAVLVSLLVPDGEHSPVSAFIGSDGAYRVAGCPVGEARVTIHAALGRWKETNGQNAPSIPIRYTDAEQTDIVVTIERGRQELDLEP